MPHTQTSALFKLRLSIGILSAVVLLLTLGFNVLLSVSTLDRLAIESLLSGYRGAGEHAALSIERGLRFGKPLDQYAGMTELLEDLRNGVGGIPRAEVIDIRGAVLYSVREGNATIAESTPHRPAREATDTARQAFDLACLTRNATGEDRSFWSGPVTYRIVIPLKHKEVVGGLALEIGTDRVKASATEFIRWASVLLAVACVAVCVALSAWIGLLTSTAEARARLPRSLSVLLVVLVGGTQLAYSSAMLILFQSFMHQAVHDKAALVAHFIQRDFEYIIHKGVDVRALQGGEELLLRVVKTHAELSGASLVDTSGTVLAQAGRIDAGGTTVERSVDAYWPSRFRQRQEVMRVRLHTDPAFVTKNVRGLGLDLATTLGMSLLFLMELAKLLGMLSTRIMGVALGDGAATRICSAKALRAAGFLFFLGYDMCISFIPLMARKLHAPLWGLSEQVLAGLPISAEMVCAGIALLGAGMLSERMGWRAAYALGAVSAAAGLILGGLADSLPGLIAARGMAGFGFGLALMASQIGTLEDEKAGAGIADVFAGIFSGSICGSAAGAMLADRLGFEAVFFVAAGLVPFALLALGASRANHGAHATPHPEATARPATHGGHAAWAFLRDPRMHLLLNLIGLPAAVCLTGFLYYLLPLRLSENLVPQSDIGRIFMIYGLCFITVGPMLGRWLDRMPNKGIGAVLTGLLSGAALLVAGLSSTLGAAALAVLAVGIAQCLAAPSTMLCVVSLSSARTLGRGKTASLYRTLERIGQVLGPILFGLILARFGVDTTLVTVGGAICAMAALFGVLWRISAPQA